ncbi:hypothetical protein C0995_004551 [Termitomyces sp. Mi166|nr:hypothetical protein C0995_004551 [Termitomyces sp. Mi166\
MPPTPYLTRSPTPTLPPPSPKHPALSLHSTNTNRGEKRRKDAEDAEDPQEGFLQALAEFDLAPGCGRTLINSLKVPRQRVTTVWNATDHINATVSYIRIILKPSRDTWN